MASEANDPSEVGSPLFFPNSDEDYEDQTELQDPNDGLDLPMPDVEDVFARPSPTNDGRGTVAVNTHEDSSAETTISEQIRTLLNGSIEDNEANTNLAQLETSDPPTAPNHPRQDADVPIKEEIPDFEIMSERFVPAEVIDISDSDEDVGQKHSNSLYRYGNTLAGGVIEISDGEVEIEEKPAREEIIVYEDGSTSVTIKKENPDVEFLGAKQNPVEAPEDSSSEDEPQIRSAPTLGRGIPRLITQKAQLTPATIEKLKQVQKLYTDKAVAANRVATGAGRIFKVPQPSGHPPPGNDASDDNVSWMGSTVLPDRPATNFQNVKQSYRAKRKSRKNTLEDDVEFKRARNEENDRLKRLALETADDGFSEEEAEESDDGLFVSDTPKASDKPRFTEPIDEDDDDDDLVLTRMLAGKSAPKKSKADNPSDKPELSTKRSRAKERDRELRFNMMAGIEAILLRDQRRKEEAAAKQVGPKAVEKLNKRKKTKPVDISAKRTKTGRMTNIGSLMTSNIYEDSNANLNKPALPHIADKKKKDFLTSLVANVPLEDLKKAKQDKVDIERASKILGNYKVIPDGKGRWAFKGMKSSLFHYQVQGAACMKTREIGTQAPYGGILADEMGLGKTGKCSYAHVALFFLKMQALCTSLANHY